MYVQATLTTNRVRPKIGGQITQGSKWRAEVVRHGVDYPLPDPASIRPANIPERVLKSRTVLLRTFMRPITCSVPLLVQGTSFCQSKTR